MKKIGFLLTLLGVPGFVSIVFALHVLQVDYNPAHQLMSELALGDYGWLMVLAFAMFSLAIFGDAFILIIYKSHIAIILLLIGAAWCLFAAGIFKLGDHTDLHVSLVALAFILLGLAMYLVPRLIETFQNFHGRLMSWGLGLGAALSVYMGHSMLPIGIAQRLAVSFILLWLCGLAFGFFKKN